MIEDLINSIIKYKGDDALDAIVVEGYEGVGKGYVLSQLSTYYGVTPYRPDYNLWQQFDHRKIDRWKVSGFFWDVYSHFDILSTEIMLFDRGVLSGAVYNDDMSIASNYKTLLRDKRVIHILVVCSEEDYYSFSKSRNPNITDEEIREEWLKFSAYTSKYMEAIEISGVDYIIYRNEYLADLDKDTCSSCGHYSYGMCMHPRVHTQVDSNQKRCELSTEREVQDYDSEVYSLQSS